MILLFTISNLYGQKKNEAEASRYVKTDNPAFKYIAYKSASKNKNQTLDGEACDNRAIIQIPENKTINNVLKNAMGEDLLKKSSNDGVLILSINFTSNGKIEDVGFLVPRNIGVEPKQLELIEENLKKNLRVDVLQFNKDKKYICYGIRVPFSKILDGTYPY